MRVTGIITARMASKRFPGKPMTDIEGIPMVGHVYFRSRLSKRLTDVHVATCDREIFDYIRSVGGNAVMTSDTHQRASERVAEAMTLVEQSSGKRIDYAVLIQGDEPLLLPSMVDELVASLDTEPSLKVVNLISRISDDAEFRNPNTIKVVMDKNDFAIYLSREPIPSTATYHGEVPMWRQLGMIMFERDTLLKYIELGPSRLETIESIDMNRFLEHGMKLKFVRTEAQCYSIDVPEDKPQVLRIMKHDPLFLQYAETHARA